MRRIAVLTLAVALVAAACGDDDAATGDTTAATSAPASTGAPASTAAPASTEATTASTSAPTTSTAVTTTTTEAAGNPLLEAALQFAGAYVGAWNNTTFGSTGAIETTIEVDEAAETATVTMDLGGFVFGGADPDPIVTVMDLTTEPPYETTNGLLGDASIDFALDGMLTLTAPAVPGLGGSTLIVEGLPDPVGFEMTYRIENPDGSIFAEGTADMAPNG